MRSTGCGVEGLTGCVDAGCAVEGLQGIGSMELSTPSIPQQITYNTVIWRRSELDLLLLWPMFFCNDGYIFWSIHKIRDNCSGKQWGRVREGGRGG